MNKLHPGWWGLAGTILMTLGSFGGGATRNRGGVLEALGLKFLSFGHGGGLSTAVLWIGVFLLVGAWVLVGKQVVVLRHQAAHPEKAEQVIERITLLWIAPLLLAAPLMSRDVYSYLMQGAMTRDGFDPYSEGAAVNPGPYLLEVSHDWRNTTTPYGPMHLWIGEGVTRLVGDNVTAGILLYKIISLLGFLAIMWAVPRIARYLGGDPGLALWLGVTNPVMIIHLIGGMHNESVMVGLVSLGLVACVKRHFALGVVVIAAAVSLKATAAIALPFVVWMATNHYSPTPRPSLRRFLTFFVCAAAGVVLTLGTVVAITWLSGTSWGWLAEITGNSKVINPLAGPTLVTELLLPFIQLFDPTFDYNVVLKAARALGSVLMLLGLVISWWLFRRNDREAIAGICVAYLVAFIFNSVTLPWYYASILVLVGTFHRNRTITQWAAGLSVFIALAFAGSGNHQLYNLWWVGATAVGAWGASAWLLPLGQPGVIAEGIKRPSPVRDESLPEPHAHEEHQWDGPAECHPQKKDG